MGRSWAQRVTYKLSRTLLRLLTGLYLPVRCRGLEHWPADGGALVCANHQSYLDPPLVGMVCPRRLNYLARKNLFDFALFRWLIVWFDAIPIEREGLGIGGLKETLRRLKRGELVLIFPEGSRTRDGELGAFQPGFCAVLRRTKVSLVPVAIDGTFQAWPRTRRFPRPARIQIRIGSPMPWGEMEGLGDDEIVAELRSRIAQGLEQIRHHD